MTNTDDPFAHCNPRVRLKRTILTLNLTTFKAEKKNHETDLEMEQCGKYQPMGSPEKTSRYDRAEDEFLTKL